MFNYTQEIYEEFYKEMQDQIKTDTAKFKTCMSLLRPTESRKELMVNFRTLLTVTESRIPAYFIIDVANYDADLFSMAVDKYNALLPTIIKIEKEVSVVTDEIRDRRKILIDNIMNIYCGRTAHISESNLGWVMEQLSDLRLFERYQSKIMDLLRENMYAGWDALPVNVINKDAVWFETLFTRIPTSDRHASKLNKLYRAGKITEVHYLLAQGYSCDGLVFSAVEKDDRETISVILHRACREYVDESTCIVMHMRQIDMLDDLMYQVGAKGDVSLFNRVYNEIVEMGFYNNTETHARMYKILANGIIYGDSLSLLDECLRTDSTIINIERMMKRASYRGSCVLMTELLKRYNPSAKCLVKAAHNHDPGMVSLILSELEVSAFIGNPNHNDAKRDIPYQHRWIIRSLYKVLHVASRRRSIGVVCLITKNLVQYHNIDPTTCTELPPFITD